MIVPAFDWRDYWANPGPREENPYEWGRAGVTAITITRTYPLPRASVTVPEFFRRAYMFNRGSKGETK